MVSFSIWVSIYNVYPHSSSYFQWIHCARKNISMTCTAEKHSSTIVIVFAISQGMCTCSTIVHEYTKQSRKSLTKDSHEKHSYRNQKYSPRNAREKTEAIINFSSFQNPVVQKGGLWYSTIQIAIKWISTAVLTKQTTPSIEWQFIQWIMLSTVLSTVWTTQGRPSCWDRVCLLCLKHFSLACLLHVLFSAKVHVQQESKQSLL